MDQLEIIHDSGAIRSGQNVHRRVYGRMGGSGFGQTKYQLLLKQDTTYAEQGSAAVSVWGPAGWGEVVRLFGQELPELPAAARTSEEALFQHTQQILGDLLNKAVHITGS